MSFGEFLLGFFLCLVMALLLYIQAHIIQEIKSGKTKKLFWEKKNEKKDT